MTSELEQEFFRVWDKNQNKMFIPQDNINYCKIGGYVVGIEIYQNMSGSIKPVIRPSAIYDNAISMQCTGRKDKNGKLIYEGDVLEIDFKSKNNCFWTLFDKPNLKFLVKREGMNFRIEQLNYFTDHMEHLSLEDMEVVGNIYEDKELLNE